MDIRQLLYFTTIAEEGSISAAAKKLHLSQPPLSYQMKLLEEELHLPLIERSARGIALTEAGRVLYKRAQGILELSELTRKEMLAMASGFTGTLHIGTVSSSGASLLGWRIPAFHQKYPQIGFAIHEGNTFELMEMLESGLIELAIVRTPFHNDQLNCLYLSPEPMIAAGAASFFPAGMPSGQPISLELLGHAPVILYLDPDLVVLHSLRSLYQIDFDGKLFAAASHIESRTFRELNRRRLHLSEHAKYLNSGVMMMNLALLRKESPQTIINYIQSHKATLLLPDQDVLNALYADRTVPLDPLVYNLGEKYLRLKNLHLPPAEKLTLDWVRSNTAIVHYYGRNKPWKEHYRGSLGIFYHEWEQQLQQLTGKN